MRLSLRSDVFSSRQNGGCLAGMGSGGFGSVGLRFTLDALLTSYLRLLPSLLFVLMLALSKESYGALFSFRLLSPNARIGGARSLRITAGNLSSLPLITSSILQHQAGRQAGKKKKKELRESRNQKGDNDTACFFPFPPLKRYYCNSVKRTQGRYGKAKPKGRRQLLNCKEVLYIVYSPFLGKKKDEHGTRGSRGVWKGLGDVVLCMSEMNGKNPRSWGFDLRDALTVSSNLQDILVLEMRVHG
ncbi:hypothetical protein V8C44DRAFT_284782 [Trichoderma aethiopicum]